MGNKREMLSAEQQLAAWGFIKEAGLNHALSRLIDPVLESKVGTLGVLIDVDTCVEIIEKFNGASGTHLWS